MFFLPPVKMAILVTSAILLWILLVCRRVHRVGATDPEDVPDMNQWNQQSFEKIHQGMKTREGSYIVQFQPDIDNDIVDSMLTNFLVDNVSDGTRVEHFLERLFPGVSLTNASVATIEALRSENFVQSIIQDSYMELDYMQENPLNWGLDRIDGRELPMNGLYKYHCSGFGTEIYIMDTGLYRDHKEFSNLYDAQDQIERIVRCGFDAFGGNCEDDIGHGTYIAGIAAGVNYGVAKKADVISVKIYRDRTGGSIALALAGLEYVLQQKKARPEQPMVINFSLSGSKSELLNNAVHTLVAAGVVVVVSAGNRAGDSCLYSPASATGTITVSAVDYQDAKASYANAGKCVSIYAPGHQIPSAWIRDQNDKAYMSGTSAAAAHVTGVVAQYLELYPHWSPKDIATAIKIHATPGTVTDYGNETSDARLLHNGDLKFNA